MISKVENILKKYKLLNSENTFIIGFSGGYDSYCLLDVMWELSQIYGFTIIPAHLNHNWRGNESYQEQARCQEIAMKYKLNFITDTLNDNIKISENSAREARYNFFEKYAKLFDAIVLTAHNLNDNAETLIYRITKGTGISGLKGIPEFVKKNNIKYVRPLLKISRNEIENYCKEKALYPNEDSSNDSLDYKRNYIRKNILPALENININVIKSINNLSELAQENEEILDDLIKEYFDNGKILFKKYVNASIQLQSKILHKMLSENHLEYDRKKINEIVNFLSNKNNIEKKYSLTSNLWIIFNDNFIYFITDLEKEKNLSETKITGLGKFDTNFNTFFEVSKITNSKKFPKEKDFEAFISMNNNDFPFVLRTRREGDVIQPFGMKGKMKLKKYLISKKIPQTERDDIMLLTKANEVFWVIGVGLSEKLRVAKSPDYVFKYKKKDN